MTRPRVSICMPVHNGASMIERAIRSALDQDFTDFELIVSENASTDGTREVVERAIAGDPRCRVIQHTNIIIAIRNFAAALAEAQGEFVVFLAHDDWWNPDFLSRLVALGDRDPSLQLMVPRARWFDDEGKSDFRRPFPGNLGTGLARVNKLMRWAKPHWFYGLYRREPLQRAFGFLGNYERMWGWDFVVLLPILLSGKVEGSHEAVTHQLAFGIGSSDAAPRKAAEQAQTFSEFLRRCITIMRATTPSAARRVMLLPLLLDYANRHTWKLNRILQSYLRERREARR